ncbi:peptidase A4 family-domain-containing protein [Lanmaoa asiatica]|nr:peptidase A4 family-domain-containing protein [Lanmaoa asiatica]
MLFNPAFLSGFLFASAVLALSPFRYGTGVARGREGRQSQFNDRLEQPTSSVSDVVYSANWAGALWDKTNGSFTSVTGTLAVPNPSGGNGAAASAWVGIDGDTCTGAILQTGIDFTLSNGQVSYNAWYEWYPDSAHDFSGFDISAGDVIKLTVTASSTTSGTATVENLTNGQTVSKSLSSTFSLCERSAEWIVEDFAQSGGLAPFANFGSVTFMNAEATGTGTYTPSGATTVNIQQNNQILTSVSIGGSSVTVKYV